MGITEIRASAVSTPWGFHDVLRRLFYLPVIAAEIAGGMRGGLLVAAAVAGG